MNVKYTKEILEIAVKNCHSIQGVLKQLGLKLAGGNHTHITNRIKYYGINIDHFSKQSWSKGLQLGIKITKEDFENNILVKNSQTNNCSLKKRLIYFGYKKNYCEICGCNTYNNMPLSFELHHINGNKKDNRLENLQILCPNCHSQTINFSGKKHYKRNKPAPYKNKCVACNKDFLTFKKQQQYCSLSCSNKSKVKTPKKCVIRKDYLEVLLWTIPTTKIALQYGVSDKTIEKLSKEYGLSKPSRGYWAKIQKGDVAEWITQQS